MRAALFSRLISLVLVAASLVAPAHAADAAKIQVMLVATYHFSNPGQDINNVKAVDVLNPVRQKEIAQVVQRLAKFAPTRVMVEWPKEITDERYAKYLRRELPESANEVVQLGFRLAQLRNLSQVDGIDVDGDFPFDAVEAWAREHQRHEEIEQVIALSKVEVDRISARQHETDIGGVLRYVNSTESIDRNHSLYPRLLTMGSGTDQPGVALLSAWQTRNLAICAKLLEAARPGDRIVTFFGQGHIHLLQQCLREQADVKVIDPLAFL